MREYLVPVSVKAFMKVSADNDSDAEYLAAQTLQKVLAESEDLKIETDFPKTLRFWMVSSTTFVKAYTHEEAQTIVDDLFNAGCRKDPDKGDRVTSFDIDAVTEAE